MVTIGTSVTDLLFGQTIFIRKNQGHRWTDKSNIIKLVTYERCMKSEGSNNFSLSQCHYNTTKNTLGVRFFVCPTSIYIVCSCLMFTSQLQLKLCCTTKAFSGTCKTNTAVSIPESRKRLDYQCYLKKKEFSTITHNTSDATGHTAQWKRTAVGNFMGESCKIQFEGDYLKIYAEVHRKSLF